MSKIGRYSDRDIEDISVLIETVDKKLLSELIENVLSRNNISERVKAVFKTNLQLFRERFDV